MNSPIVFFAYNRPQHTRDALLSLSVAKYASDTELYIYCDGPKSADEALAVEEVRRICRHTSGFLKTTVVCRERNIGLAANVIDGVGMVIAKHGRAIVVEDDLIVSPSFIAYMNAALDFYEGKNVFSISGYMPRISISPDYPYSTCLISRNASWGWATWKECWQKVDWEVTDFDSFITSKSSTKSFNKAGNDLTMMLLKQKQGQINSWSVRFCYAGFKAGWPTVYPVNSLVSNNGVDGSGTNMRRSTRYSTDITDAVDLAHFAPAGHFDARIAKNFRQFYNVSWLRWLINFFKIKAYVYRR